MNKLLKDVKQISKAFTKVNAQIQMIKGCASDLYDSEDEDEASHFHISEIDFGNSNS